VGTRFWLTWGGILAAGIGGPILIANHLQLGSYAKSPQTVELGLGSSVLVGGGRAKLWFAQVDMGPMVEVSCRKQTAMIELHKGEPSDEVCRIRVEYLDLKETEFKGHSILRGRFRVTWAE
jgi:hypothetical protein